MAELFECPHSREPARLVYEVSVSVSVWMVGNRRDRLIDATNQPYVVGSLNFWAIHSETSTVVRRCAWPRSLQIILSTCAMTRCFTSIRSTVAAPGTVTM